MAVKHVKRLTQEEYEDRLEWLVGPACVGLLGARTPAEMEETLRRIQHAAQECALYIADTANAEA